MTGRQEWLWDLLLTGTNLLFDWMRTSCGLSSTMAGHCELPDHGSHNAEWMLRQEHATTSMTWMSAWLECWQRNRLVVKEQWRGLWWVVVNNNMQCEQFWRESSVTRGSHKTQPRFWRLRSQEMGGLKAQPPQTRGSAIVQMPTLQCVLECGGASGSEHV
jgi:hypothetical protein